MRKNVFLLILINHNFKKEIALIPNSKYPKILIFMQIFIKNKVKNKK
jgi:hypothetical protein